MAPRTKKQTAQEDLNQELNKRLAELRSNISNEPEEKLGQIHQVMGAVVDVKFNNSDVLLQYNLTE